ncbi:MAG: homoserine O-acetyltransferase [Rhodopirellula sp.]|nr:homoserine O-acetyltransferase [Rhodopirellula sp.]
MSDSFSSSDSVRHARPLKHVQHAVFDDPLELEYGGRLPRLTVTYETYGRLNQRRDNAILLCHALSGDSHVAQHDERDDPGWWDLAVGPGKSIDTDRYFVVCPNVLGGCRGTTGPNSTNPRTDRPYGAEFPVITVGDIVRVQKLLMDRLGIERLLAVVGASLGGHMVLDWATRFPDQVAGAVAIATSPRPTSQALAFDIVGRNAILRDPHYCGGQYYGNGPGPAVGLALARMLGHITYLSREAMTQKFDASRLEPQEVQTLFEARFNVGSYLAYQGDRFVERFDANSYLRLTMAMDLFDLGDSPAKVAKALCASRCRWLVVSFSTDWLFPPFQSQEIVRALLTADKPVSYCSVTTDCGHDAFLLPNELAVYGGITSAFLDNLHTDSREPVSADAATIAEAADGENHGPTSIYRHHRLDYDSILRLVPPGASVLDLGCGTGGLLTRLRDNGHYRLVGVELDERAILTSVRRGLDVVQMDLNRGLEDFSDGQFDCVILSQTLQAVTDVKRVLADVLRVGRQGIVSFPNLAYSRWREELAEHGRAPQVEATEGFHWYDTPNVRFFSIADFEQLCAQENIRIDQRIAVNTESNRIVFENPNLAADVAVFSVSRSGSARQKAVWGA